MKRKICAFSGHRPSKFPWRYDETDKRCIKLKSALAGQIASLVDCDGVTDMLVGGAEGADMWAALTVLSLCEKNPALRLHCILPCRGQSDSWSASAREQYQGILDRADGVFYMHREYRKGCMLERNRFMVDHADMLLAVYNGEWRIMNPGFRTKKWLLLSWIAGRIEPERSQLYEEKRIHAR